MTNADIKLRIKLLGAVLGGVCVTALVFSLMNIGGEVDSEAEDGLPRDFVADTPFSPPPTPPERESAPLDDVGASPAEPSLDFESGVSPAGYIAGQVVDTFGRPVGGARVYPGRISPLAHLGESGLASHAAAVCDADGRFRMDAPEATLTHLSAFAPDFQIAVVPLPDRAGPRANVRIEMAPAGIVEGMIALAGRPVSGIIQLHYGQALDQPVSVRSTEQGYRFGGLPDGIAGLTATITGEDGRDRSVKREAVIAAGEVTRVDFDFPGASGAIAGRVTVNGLAPARANLQLAVFTGAGRESYATTADAEGLYQMDGLVEGIGYLRVSAIGDDGPRVHIEVISIGGGLTEVPVDLSGVSTITGMVPVVQVAFPRTIRLLIGDVAAPMVSELTEMDVTAMTVYSAQVDANGAFEFQRVSAGTYTLVMSDDGESFLTLTVHVGSDEHINVDMTVP